MEKTEQNQVDAHVKRMEMIISDMKEDARRFDGQEFNGKTVAEYFGCQGATIAALADTIKFLLEKE